MWLYRDGAGAVHARLVKHFTPGELFCEELPPKWTPRDGPKVVVVSDGVPVSSRGWTREAVRITVHCGDKITANKILRLIDGHLMKPTPSAWAFAVKPATSLIVRPDSRLGGWVASAVYNVVLNRKKVG